MKRKILPTVLGVSVALVLGSCATKEEAKQPELTDAKFECKDQPIVMGRDAVIVGSVKSVGGPFKGLKITIKGNGVSENVLSLPSSSKSSVTNAFSEQKSLVMSSGEPSFFKVDKDTMEANLKDLECKGDHIDIKLTMQTLRSGTSDVEISVAPAGESYKAAKVWLSIKIHQLNGVLSPY